MMFCKKLQDLDIFNELCRLGFEGLSLSRSLSTEPRGCIDLLTFKSQIQDLATFKNFVDWISVELLEDFVQYSLHDDHPHTHKEAYRPINLKSWNLEKVSISSLANWVFFMVGSLSSFEKFPAIITNYSAIQVLIIHVYLTHLKCKQVITGCINKIAE